MIVVLLFAIVVLLFVVVVLFCVLGREIIRQLREIMYFYEVAPLNNEEQGCMNLTLLKPKPRGHKTRKPTDRSREWIANREKDSREVK